ncbi:MAG: hypothetical protein ACLP2Y_12575 [Limisphaerales bacterium]
MELSPGVKPRGVGDQKSPYHHLRSACFPSRDDDAFLEGEWNGAHVKLGPPITGAGLPEIKPLPSSHQTYEQTLKSGAWAQNFQHPDIGAASVCLVEIDPLLAFQFTVDTRRTNHHCAHLSSPPSLDEMLAACLPLIPPTENFHIQQHPQSVVVKSRNLNLQAQAQGFIHGAILGLQFGLSLPFTHVVRYNGRCYLHNGFHRTYGLRIAGATHVPCILRDVIDPPSVGIRSDGSTFDIALLESSNPPTLAHFTQGRAHAVSLRAMSRILHVSWADYVIPEE